jgi:pyruvate/2-oxoglutarate dehydrogenase complex dihydrolipoamide dehydrogenase (E3) component
VKAAVLERSPDSLPGFFDACIREPHQDQLRKAARDIDFNIYGKSMDAHGEGAFDAYHKNTNSFFVPSTVLPMILWVNGASPNSQLFPSLKIGARNKLAF